MADGYIQVPPDDTGKKVDATELITTSGTVERQRVEIPDEVDVSGDLLTDILAEQRVQNLLLAQAFQINDDLDILRGEMGSTGAGTPGGDDTEIQYNDAGDFAGDPDFTWVADSGVTILQHAALGNYAAINTPTFAPGDPINQSSSAATSAVFVLSEYFTGNALGFLVTQSFYPGYKHTGAAVNGSILALDIDPVINSDSIGAWSSLNGVAIYPVNFGSGNVDFIQCMDLLPGHVGSGHVLAVYGIAIHATNQTAGGGTVDEVYGILIDDHSGSGATENINLVSAGAASRNEFGGTINFGTATNATLANGDFWFDGTNLKLRTGGATKTVTVT